jgi:hypothetical protein
MDDQDVRPSGACPASGGPHGMVENVRGRRRWFFDVRSTLSRRDRLGRSWALSGTSGRRGYAWTRTLASGADPLDGLAIAIRFALSSRACEGAWAGPDAMVVGVSSSQAVSPAPPVPWAGCRRARQARIAKRACCVRREIC